MTTILVDCVTGKELEPEQMAWIQASLDLVRTELSPKEFEAYKARLLVACHLEERLLP